MIRAGPRRFPIGRAVAAAGALACACAGDAGADGFDAATRSDLARAVSCVNLSLDDLGWEKHPVADPFRLACVDETLDRPLELAARADRAARDFADLPGSALSAAAWLDVATRVPAIGDDGRVPPGLEATLVPLLERLAAAESWSRRQVAVATAPLTDGERALLRERGAALYLDDSDEPGDPSAVLAAAAKVDLRALASAAAGLAVMAAELREAAASAGAPQWTTRVLELADGTRVSIGGPGPDVHRGARIVVDAGGDDVGEGCAFVLDLGGDDRWIGCGSGLFDAGLVVDVAGDDVHAGGDVAVAGAVAGASILLDLAGDDRYESSQLSQGAAVLGVAILHDAAGDDTYRGARFVQGFGGVRGLGALVDVAGEDSYWAGGTFPHAPLLPENFQSLSQGFGFGLRPHASGGVGVLLDRGGNDAYHAEVYGQGASYWLALGLLVDEAGHDKYSLFQYGQGAGIHLSSGALLDRAGHDGYTCNNGVAQGSGHDWAVGLLWDRAGQDAYQGSGMSQGGANANGIGMLVDESGHDSYAGWNERNQGDSFPARGSVGLGLLLDRAGRDRYTHGGADGATWTRGSVGVGLDVPEPEAP